MKTPSLVEDVDKWSKRELEIYGLGHAEGESCERATLDFILEDTKFADLMDGKDWTLGDLLQYIKKLEAKK